MAYCPECQATLAPHDAVCPHCGYDFPPSPEPPAQYHLHHLFQLMCVMAVVYWLVRGWGAPGFTLVILTTGCLVLLADGHYATPLWLRIPYRTLFALLGWTISLILGGVLFGPHGLNFVLSILFCRLLWKRWE